MQSWYEVRWELLLKHHMGNVQGETDQSDDAAAALPERVPAFTQPRGPLKPEHSFEVNAIW